MDISLIVTRAWLFSGFARELQRPRSTSNRLICDAVAYVMRLYETLVPVTVRSLIRNNPNNVKARRTCESGPMVLCNDFEMFALG